jgi:hypothetical protein
VVVVVVDVVVVLEVVVVDVGTLVVVVVVVVPPSPEPPPPPPSGPLSAAKVHVPRGAVPRCLGRDEEDPGRPHQFAPPSMVEPAARQLKAGSLVAKPARAPAGSPSPSSGSEARTTGVRGHR